MRIICGWIEPQLAAFDAGTLAVWRADLVARHVAGCERCRSAWETTANLGVLLRESTPPVPPPASDLWSRLEGQLTPREPARRRPAVALGWPVAATACALVGVGVAVRAGLWSPRPVTAPEVARRIDTTPAQRVADVEHAPVKPVPAKPALESAVDSDPDPFVAKSASRPTPAPPSDPPQDRLPQIASGEDLRAMMQRAKDGLPLMSGVRGKDGRIVSVDPRRISRPDPDRADPRPVDGLASGDAREPDALSGVAVADASTAPDPVRTPRRTMPDDLTGNASFANRPPTEAANLGGMQRGLFR